jgi:polyisoprenoid-binding protein YceI
MKQFPYIGLIAVLAGCSPQADKSADEAAPAATAPVNVDLPAGTYTLDRAHASLIFKVNHLGFSNYTARFKHFDAELHLDPKKPAAASLMATVDSRSIETDFPDPATLDFNAQLRGAEWLNAEAFPAMTYKSTAIEMTGPNTANITGDLTLRGVTHPVVLEATYNGGWKGIDQDPHARIGFSAHGTLKRSDYGMSFGIPAPGTNFGVGDEVSVIIEAEFSGPPRQKPE